MFSAVYRWAFLLPFVACGSLVLCASSCGSGSDPSLFEPVDAGAFLSSPGRSGAGGSSIGRGGTGGTGGSSGSSAGSGMGGTGSIPDAGQAGADAGVDASLPVPCNVDADCSSNACATGHCSAGFCSPTFAAQGTACGGPGVSECVDSVSCDGAGSCVPQQVKARGTLCGSASPSECANHDSCDGAGVCRPDYLPLSTPCGDQSTTTCSFPDVCDGLGSCSPNNAAAGIPCGGDAGATECSSADTCDGQGACTGLNQPNGTACSGGSCTQGQCIQGQPAGCPGDVANTVPFSITWSSVTRPNLYDSSCEDPSNGPDYALVFTAPTDGTYRFLAHGLVDGTPHKNTSTSDGDAVMAIARGSCGGLGATELACDDDISGSNLDSRIDVALTQDQVVTVYLNEFGEPDGGTGTLTITRTGP
ncbi:MAG TPA: hypothetical protein VG963_07310 [Polyangiaceae bacterium]|nr:hypothetical protein [Polyangiaceae bacterium]